MYITGLELILGSILIIAMLLLIVITHVMNRRLLKADDIHVSEKGYMRRRIEKLTSVNHSNVVDLIRALYMCNDDLFHFDINNQVLSIKHTNIRCHIDMKGRKVKFITISGLFFKEEDTTESINQNLTSEDHKVLVMMASTVRLNAM